MSLTLHSELNHVLAEFHARLSALLGVDLVGIYLHGSLAIGDFDQEDSDIDFLVVIESDLTTSQVNAVRELHRSMAELPSPFARRLEGSYFPRELLKDPAAVGHAPLWFMDNGTKQLSQETHDNRWVVLWVMHHHGITVCGPHHRELFGPVSVPALHAEVQASLRNLGENLVSGAKVIGSVWNQSFIVLSYCRMLQTLETGEIHSKPAAVRWAETALAGRWRPLVRRALLRRGDRDGTGREPAESSEVDETISFIQYALAKAPTRTA